MAVLFLKCQPQIKDGKEHRYWSVMENHRCGGGKTVQRQVLYLGEINDSQRLSGHPREFLQAEKEDRRWPKPASGSSRTKQTRSRDHKRCIPLEPDAAAILRPLAGEGPVIACWDNHLYIKRRELAHDMNIKLPETV